MNFLDRITGNDINRQWKAFKARAKKLPPEYQTTWMLINAEFWQRSDFTGRNIMPILEGVLELFEEANADGRRVEDVLGGDIKGFCALLAGEQGAKTYRDRWRDRMNASILRKLGR
jgi:DNA-binding ferritin-like protein (Dps family)